jgi:glycosyltransferase involved in cell wall biosynthesis
MRDVVRVKYKDYVNRGLLVIEEKLSPAQIPKRLSRAKLVIIPSTVDNLPYVVLEMMAMGKIVLASKQGGQAEVIDNGIDGFIFDHDYQQTFFDQLALVLKLNEEEKRSISQHAVEKINLRYSPSIIYHEKVLLLNDIKKTNFPRPTFPFIRAGTPAICQRLSNISKGRLSIVIPYFNMGKYIQQTLQSLFKSNYQDKEIIIVNDGSTDLASITELEHLRRQPSVRVIDIANGGLAAARNLGAAYANGEFLAFLDADDTVQPDYYTRAVKVLSHYPNVYFVGCWVQYFDGSRNVWPTFTPEAPLILYHNLVNSSGLVYKRDAFLSVGQNDTMMEFPGLEDYESVVSMVSAGLNGVVLPEILFNYRVRKDSMIRSVSRVKKLHLYAYISHKHKKFYANFATDVFNLTTVNGPGDLLDNPSLDHLLADRVPFGGKLSRKIILLVKKNKIAKTIAYRLFKLLKN